MPDKKFVVGQRVMMTRTYGKPTEQVVTKLGRAYAYIGEGHQKMQVNISTGAEENGFGRVYTLPEWEERKRLNEVHEQLRAHGIGPVGTSRFKQSIETLEALLAVLQQVEPSESSARGGTT